MQATIIITIFIMISSNRAQLLIKRNKKSTVFVLELFYFESVPIFGQRKVLAEHFQNL